MIKQEAAIRIGGTEAEAVALHDAYDRKGSCRAILSSRFSAAWFELLKAREQQGFDDSDFFRQLYRIKFNDEVLQRRLPLRDLQRTVARVVSFLSLSAGEMQVAANAVELHYLLGSGLLVE